MGSASPGREEGQLLRGRQPSLLLLLGALALLAALAFAAERAHAQSAGGSDSLLRPALDGDPRNPPRFNTDAPRGSETSRFTTAVPNYRYQPAAGAGTTGFDSTGAPRRTKATPRGRLVNGTRPPANGTQPPADDGIPTPPAPAKPAGPTIVIPQIAQPEPNPLLPDPVARPARSPPRSSVPVALEPASPPVVPPDTTVVLPPRRWALQELRPFEALGVQYGSFLFRPAVELTRGYDTNPARTMPASGSWYSIVAPQLLVNSDWSRHELTATLRGSYTDYDTANQLNRPLVDAKVNGRIDVTALTRIDLEGRYYLGTDSPGSPNIQANLLWYPIYHQLGFTGGLGQRINHLDLSLKGGADRTTYTDSHFDDGEVSSNADRNFNRFFTTGRATYEISPGLRPFSEWTADSRVYDLGVDAGGDNRNSQGISGKFGTAFELTQKLTGEASAGYIRRHYDDPQLPSFGAYLIDASLIFTASALTTLRFTAVTTVSETTLSGVSGVLTREYTGQVDHAFRRWLIGTLRFMRGTDVYVGSPRVDIRYSAAAQLSYMLTRDWWARAEYRNEWRDSNQPGQDYSANVYLVGLRWQR